MGHGLRCALADERPKDRGPPTAPRGWLPGPQRRLLALVDCWCQLALTSELLPGEPTGLGRRQVPHMWPPHALTQVREGLAPGAPGLCLAG